MKERRAWEASYLALAVLLVSSALAACSGPFNPDQSQQSGIQKIKHIIVIMQENRSFDSYFGTFPGRMVFP